MASFKLPTDGPTLGDIKRMMEADSEIFKKRFATGGVVSSGPDVEFPRFPADGWKHTVPVFPGLSRLREMPRSHRAHSGAEPVTVIIDEYPDYEALRLKRQELLGVVANGFRYAPPPKDFNVKPQEWPELLGHQERRAKDRKKALTERWRRRHQKNLREREYAEMDGVGIF